MGWGTYHISLVSHEDGKVGEVTAGASGVALVGVQQLAALSGPVSHHAALRVIPEGTVGIVVMLLLQDTGGGSEVGRRSGQLNMHARALQYA